ncbi:hypothetical protein RHMOL_Rhmol03G0028500 [Rhododendron molle]|uniref:Uncharacterized protein n=1 Tax=Rhododendron molle TaxID=49168 RepID=A0ACC0PAW7_RHOML|nr:hypothetical protein RHMOL_Rhmol03G0028500 [Rhododendron molle]
MKPETEPTYICARYICTLMYVPIAQMGGIGKQFLSVLLVHPPPYRRIGFFCNCGKKNPAREIAFEREREREREMEIKPVEISSSKMFGGFNKRYKHYSPTLGCSMTFHIYFPPPPPSSSHKFAVLYWLSGLTCSDENFIAKSGAQRVASSEGIALIAPDTSPNAAVLTISFLEIFIGGLNVEGEADSWDFGVVRVSLFIGLTLLFADGLWSTGTGTQYGYGTGAGFYLNATQDKWKNWQMYDYVVKELPQLLSENFPQLDTARASIFGHSMGGHGALTIYLKNLDKYKSVSAFSPVVNPLNCPWGQKAFTNYLGANKADWEVNS